MYCYAGDIEKKKTVDMMTINDYINLFSQAYNIGCKSVIITGALSRAEPLLSKKLIPILNHLDSIGMISVIFTNLSVLGDENLCQRIHGLSCENMTEYLYTHKVSLMISCDSITETIYNKIVNVNDQFKCFTQAVKNVENAGYLKPYAKYDNELISRVGISTVVSKDNYHELSKMKEYFHSKNWQYICKFPSLMGDALKNKESFFNPSEASNLRHEIQKHSDKPETLSLIYNNQKY